jgi:nucleotide-binding universal stress UspA family protein
VQRFRNILAPVDTPDAPGPGVARAAELARANGAVLTLIHVVETAPGELARILGALPDRRGREVEARVLADRAEALDAVAEGLRADGLDARTTVQQGKAFIRIIQRVLRDGHDIVVRSAPRHGEIGRRLASTDTHLLRKCPCPLWIVPEDHPARSRRVLAAVDPDEADTERDAVNRLVLELATSLAARDGARLDVVNAWSVPEEDTLRAGRAGLSPAEVDAIVAEEEQASAAALARLVAPWEHGEPQPVRHHVKGDAAEVIEQLVAECAADTLVMGTLGRSGTPGLLIGDTAEAVLGRVSCALLAVKPPGFVSPVLPES